MLAKGVLGSHWLLLFYIFKHIYHFTDYKYSLKCKEEDWNNISLCCVYIWSLCVKNLQIYRTSKMTVTDCHFLGEISENLN